MIIYNSIKSKFFNKVYIKEYEATLNFKIIKCPNCNSNKLIKWGKYTRNIVYYKRAKKYETTIEVKRIKCKNCNKTQSIIPNFLVPYKVHIMEYITLVIKNKIIKKTTYEDISKKYDISRQLIKYWLDCFENHFTRIATTLLKFDRKKVIRVISENIYDFSYNYYLENKLIYLMGTNIDFSYLFKKL